MLCVRVSGKQGRRLCGCLPMPVVEGPVGWAEDLTGSGRYTVMQRFHLIGIVFWKDEQDVRVVWRLERWEVTSIINLSSGGEVTSNGTEAVTRTDRRDDVRLDSIVPRKGAKIELRNQFAAPSG